MRKKMEHALDGLGWGKADDWITYSVLASVALFILGMAFSEGVWLLAFGVAAFVPIVAAYAIPNYFWMSRQREIEKELPQALYRAASDARGAPEELVAELAEGRGALAEEFGKAASQLKNGIPMEPALEDMAASNDSRLLERAVGLLLQSYRTGADMSSAFKETAEEINDIAAVVQAQGASTTIEKYTLLLAGGVIVPSVLGTLTAMVGSLDFAGLAELGFGTGSNTALLANAVLGSRIYIVEYALLAAVFVAYQEGAVEKAAIYAMVLVPLSVALFTITGAGIFV